MPVCQFAEGGTWTVNERLLRNFNLIRVESNFPILSLSHSYSHQPSTGYVGMYTRTHKILVCPLSSNPQLHAACTNLFSLGVTLSKPVYFRAWTYAGDSSLFQNKEVTMAKCSCTTLTFLSNILSHKDTYAPVDSEEKMQIFWSDWEEERMYHNTILRM